MQNNNNNKILDWLVIWKKIVIILVLQKLEKHYDYDYYCDYVGHNLIKIEVVINLI